MVPTTYMIKSRQLPALLCPRCPGIYEKIFFIPAWIYPAWEFFIPAWIFFHSCLDIFSFLLGSFFIPALHFFHSCLGFFQSCLMLLLINSNLYLIVILLYLILSYPILSNLIYILSIYNILKWSIILACISSLSYFM